MSTSKKFETHFKDSDQKVHTHADAAAGKTPGGNPEFQQGQAHSHQTLDPNDQRSLKNTLAHESRKNKQEKSEERRKADEHSKPTKPALDHGNNPSKGAKLDEELAREDEERLRQKGV